LSSEAKSLMPRTFPTTPARSKNMRAIKGANNRSTELRLRAHLAKSGCRGWCVRPRELYGRPDFAFLVEKIAIFVDGCFWHGCPKCGHIPASNKSYWRTKIARNQARDQLVSRALRSEGYLVIRIRECQLRTAARQALRSILLTLRRRKSPSANDPRA
jgi:DNA mismatch endonuclease, patch repair protein